MPMRISDTPHAQLASRTRWALIFFFGIFGLFTTVWGGRLPSIRSELAISDGQIGAILMVGAIGSLSCVGFAGAINTRLGSRNTLLLASALALLGMGGLGMSILWQSPQLFALALLINGLSIPPLNVTVNLEGARVERFMGSPVLPHMHAAFPVGAGLGSVIAAQTAALHINPGWHVISIVLVVTALRCVLIKPATMMQEGYVDVLAPSTGQATEAVELTPASGPSAISDADAGPALAVDASDAMSDLDTAGASGLVKPQRKTSRGAALAAWSERRTVLIGVVLFAATMSEGAAGNWLTLAVVDGFESSSGVGALAYGTFVLGLFTGRILGARALSRFGRVTVLYTCGSTALAGLLLFGLAPTLPLAWLGIILWGLGASMAWPTAMAASADNPIKAASRLAVTTTFASVAMVAVPPALGLIADSWGIRHALLLITIAMVVSLFATHAAAPEQESAA